MPGFKHPKDGYVFIITYGRSGSTLLQNLLNSIPGYQIRGENNNALFHLVKSLQAIKTSDVIGQMRKNQKVSDQTHPWFGAEKIEPDRVGAALAEAFAQTVLQPDKGVRVSGFKEVRFHANPQAFPAYMGFMRRYFPGSRFIFNTRDHAAVMRSAWWAKMKPEKARTILHDAETLLLSYQAAHPGDCYHVHYDDYVHSPERLEGLFGFLKEEYDPDMVSRILGKPLLHGKGQGKAAKAARKG